MQSDMFTSSYGEVFEGDERWNSLEVPEGDRFAWSDDSTYVRQPPFFEDLPPEPEPVEDIEGARVLAVLGDSVTTDHISPGGRDQEGLAGRASTSSSTGSRTRTSTPTAHGAATTR